MEIDMSNSTTPSSTWSFEEGSLTVHHLGKTVSLGRYATRELAAKAAALYFAKHADGDVLPVAATSSR
jgi:hypothetical protein